MKVENEKNYLNTELSVKDRYNDLREAICSIITEEIYERVKPGQLTDESNTHQDDLASVIYIESSGEIRTKSWAGKKTWQEEEEERGPKGITICRFNEGSGYDIYHTYHEGSTYGNYLRKNCREVAGQVFDKLPIAKMTPEDLLDFLDNQTSEA